jgi:cell division protein FtsX
MTQHIPPQTLDAIRTLFYERLAKTRQILTKELRELEVQAEVQNHRGIFASLSDLETEIQSMRAMLTVLYGYLEL